MDSKSKAARRWVFFAGLIALNVAHANHPRAIDHGPIGVMGDHYHEAGEWMVSARLMRMHMSGNQIGESKLDDSQVIRQPNAPGRMPGKLSVVPQDMDMDMLMLGAMYAPSDRLTLMAMLMASRKDMKLTSYAPPNMMMSGALRPEIGSFSTASNDLEAVSLSGLIRLPESAMHRTHLTLGIQQSVAKPDASDTALTPMGMEMTIRLPYSMQIGDESSRLNSALTHVYSHNDWAFGGQISANFKLRSKDWHLGDIRQLTFWGQRSLSDRLSLSGRVAYQRVGGLTGIDANIVAPVQTAISSNYGGSHWRAGIGANMVAPLLPGTPERLGIELEIPFKTDVRGVQMTPRWRLALGIQKSF